MTEMIDALTKGIGAELGKPIRFSYYNLQRSLEKNNRYSQCSEEMKLFITDVLALSIFNQKVITPIYGAINFSAGTKKFGVSRIRMGDYHLDKRFFVQSGKITRQFYAIVRSYGLNIEKLHVASISDFVDLWIGASRQRG